MIEQKIYQTLKTANLNPYWPGQHQGACAERYVVIKGPAGYGVNKSGKSDVLDLILFTPRPEVDGNIPSPADILEFREEVKTAMKILGHRFASDTPAIADTETMSYTLSLQYQIYRRI